MEKLLTLIGGLVKYYAKVYICSEDERIVDLEVKLNYKIYFLKSNYYE